MGPHGLGVGQQGVHLQGGVFRGTAGGGLDQGGCLLSSPGATQSLGSQPHGPQAAPPQHGEPTQPLSGLFSSTARAWLHTAPAGHGGRRKRERPRIERAASAGRRLRAAALSAGPPAALPGAAWQWGAHPLCRWPRPPTGRTGRAWPGGTRTASRWRPTTCLRAAAGTRCRLGASMRRPLAQAGDPRGSPVTMPISVRASTCHHQASSSYHCGTGGARGSTAQLGRLQGRGPKTRGCCCLRARTLFGVRWLGTTDSR